MKLYADLPGRRTVQILAEHATGSRRAVKDLLLDQRCVAGIGNIYAAEALFLAGISPRRRAGTLGPRRLERLHQSVRTVIQQGVDRRGTTLRDYVDADGACGDNQPHLGVYGRDGQPCTCGALVRRLVQGGRSSYYCPTCQR